MKELNFEKALKELETIVAQLEEGELPLSESLALFEKGVKLARYLRQELEKAEKKTEILLKDDGGKVKVVPFESDTGGKDKPETEDDGELPF